MSFILDPGNLFILLTVLLWGITPLFDKLGSIGNDAMAGVFIRGITIAVSSGLIMLFTGRGNLVAQVSWKGVALLSASGVLAGCLGVFTYFRAMQEAKDAGKVAILSSTYPLIAMLLGILLLGEKLTASKIIGGIMVTFGVILLNH